MSDSAPPPFLSDNPQFPTTSWTMIRKAVASDPETARESFGNLVEQYWYPLYLYFRAQRRCDHEEAQDLTQAFLTRLIEKPDILSRADPDNGRLRSYLLACGHNFALNDWKRETAGKRDARRTIALDGMEAAERYAREPVDQMDASKLFDRRWALALLESALRDAEAKWGDRGLTFKSLRPYLRIEGDPDGEKLQEFAARHGMSAEAASMQLSRLRKVWRMAIFDRIKVTLENPTETAIKAELVDLLGTL